MSGSSLLRFVDLVRRELDARDARIEIGGDEPRGDDRVVFQSLSEHWRVVVLFARPVEGDRERIEERLAALVSSFAGLTDEGEVANAERHIAAAPAARALDDELAGLVSRVKAIRGVVIDSTSPMLWGTSEPRHGREDVTTAIWTADAAEIAKRHGLDLAELLDSDAAEVERRLMAIEEDGVEDDVEQLGRDVLRIREQSRRTGRVWWSNHLLASRAIAGVRKQAHADEHEHRFVYHEDGFGYLARSFANIYWLVLVFDGEFSELHAEGSAVHLLPLVERLVLSLPPVDPSPRGGRVIRFPRN